MFADTRYLPSPLSPGLLVGSSCHSSLQRFREPFVFQGAVYTMAAYRTGDGGRGTGDGVVRNINHNRASFYRQKLCLFLLDFSIFLHSLSWDGPIRTSKMRFCQRAANVCNYEKRGKRNTYLVCARM